MTPLPSLAAAVIVALTVASQTAPQAPRTVPQAPTPPATPPAPPPVETTVAPVNFTIGPEDVLGIVFWREPEISGDVTVRPDGRISLPVIGEIQAAGLQPDVLQKRIVAQAGKYLTDPNVTVVVRTINSRKIYVTGRVGEPGTFVLTGPRTVMQAIAEAGGLTEYADAKNITIIRTENGVAKTFKFNYRDVSRGRSLDQNILLQPGDTVVVP